MKYLILILLLLPFTVNAQPHYQDVNWEGNEAYFSKNYKKALKLFNEALELSIKQDDKQYQAIAMYGLARTSAHLCKLEESEEWFLKSIRSRESLPDQTSAHLTQNLLEYSRFLMAHNRDDEAIPYMDRAIPKLEELGIEDSDPIAYANFLNDYERILRSNGRSADAEKVSARATDLLSKYPNEKAKFTPEKYPVNCN
jgi:tetratricopeptide (TPR) repeat protein